MFILHLSSILYFTDEHGAGLRKKNATSRKCKGRIRLCEAATDRVVQEVVVVCVVLKLYKCLDMYNFSLN